MADTPDTPTTSEKPATPRRRAPRKTPAKPSAAKTVAPKTADAAKEGTPTRKTSTPKPAKPRSTKRATPRPATKKAPATPVNAKPTRKWSGAAIAGGVAALGAAATAALLSLRGSTPKAAGGSTKPHPDQADGADTSGALQTAAPDTPSSETA